MSLTPWSFITCTISLFEGCFKHGAYITPLAELSASWRLHDIGHNLASEFVFNNFSSIRDLRVRTSRLSSRSIGIECTSLIVYWDVFYYFYIYEFNLESCVASSTQVTTVCILVNFYVCSKEPVINLSTVCFHVRFFNSQKQ